MERRKCESHRRKGTTGSGHAYEIDLLMLFKIRGERDTDKFYLETNLDGVGAFDDIVFRYWNGEKSKIIFLQAKHKENSSNGKITIEKFLNPNNDQFYLGKYLLSFLESRNKFGDQSKDPVFKGNFRDLDLKYVIYTNYILDELFDENRKIDIGNSIFSTKPKKENNRAFKFSLDQDNVNSDLIEMLETACCQERVKLLPNAFVSLVCGKVNCKNMMNNPLFSTYHVFLSKNVVDVDKKIEKDKKDMQFRKGKIKCNFFNIDNKNSLEKKFTEEVLFEYAKNEVFKEKSGFGFDTSEERDYLVNTIGESLKWNKKLDENIIERLSGTVVIMDAKKKQLKFANKDKLKDESAKQFIRQLENEGINITEHLFDIPYKFIQNSLENKRFKLHESFGNISPSFKKPEHLINQLMEIFIQFKNQNVIKINEDIVGHTKILTVGDLRNMGKFVGNFLVFDHNEKMLMLANEESLDGNVLDFVKILKTTAASRNMQIDGYKFDVKVKNFPRDTLFCCDEDKSIVREFLTKLEIFTGQACDMELREIIRDEIGTFFKLTEYEIEENWLRMRHKTEEFWRKGGYYLEKDDDFFGNIVRMNIEFDIRDPSDLFVGREDELQRLDEALKENQGKDKITVISQIASISGLGGIGKSELARKYIREYRKYYDGNAIWINAETDQTLADSFRDLSVNKLKMSTKELDETSNSIKNVVEAVYRFFASRKSIFVFDNAEKSALLETVLQVRSLLYKDNKPYVLITSRENREVWEQWGVEEGIQLDVLKEEEAMSFVRKALMSYLNIADSSQDVQIRELAVNTLSMFPLALQQAVAHIKKENRKYKRRGSRKYSINDYLREYRRKKTELLNYKVYKTLYNSYAETTFTTWKITIDKITDVKNGQHALEILDVMAFFAADSIPVNFLSKRKKDNEKLWNAVELLNRYSMIKLDQGKIYIHKLVQEVTILNMGDREKKVLREALKLFRGQTHRINFEDNQSLSYIDHALSVWSHATKHKELVRIFRKLPVSIISELTASLRDQEAHLFGSIASNSLMSTMGNNYPSIISMMEHIKPVLQNLGALEEDSKNINERARERLLFVVNIGFLLRSQGRKYEALTLFIHLYNLSKNGITCSIGETDNDSALALSYRDKLKESIDIFRKSYQLKLELFGSDHESTLDTENSISEVLEMQGEYKEALEKARQVYEKRKLICGPNHPDTLTSYGNMASSLYNLMEYDEALRIAIEVDKKREELPPDHPRALKEKSLIVCILFCQGHYDESIEKCRRFYEKRKQILRLKDSDTWSTLDAWHCSILKFTSHRIYHKALDDISGVLKEKTNTLEAELS